MVYSKPPILRLGGAWNIKETVGGEWDIQKIRRKITSETAWGRHE